MIPTSIAICELDNLEFVVKLLKNAIANSEQKRSLIMKQPKMIDNGVENA